MIRIYHSSMLLDFEVFMIKKSISRKEDSVNPKLKHEVSCFGLFFSGGYRLF